MPNFAEHYACGICLRVCNAKAFDGEFRDIFTQTVRAIDPSVLAESLTRALPKPWTAIPPEPYEEE